MQNFTTAIALLALLAVAQPSLARAETKRPVMPIASDDPRGEPELTVCSQNLQNYGSYELSLSRTPGLSRERYRTKEDALITRIAKTGCDVVAVQEVLGKNEIVAAEVLTVFAARLRERSGRFFDVRVGASNDPLSRIGFLVAKDRADILNVVSYSRVELPKLTPRERPRLFSRGPLEIQLSVRGRGDAPSKIVSLISFHFKSKGGMSSDPAELEFESYRSQMSEALRRVIENRHSESFSSGQSILLALGDRNSNFDSASAAILEGRLTLKEFIADGAPCRLSKRGAPICKRDIRYPQRLFSVLRGDPTTRGLPGTYHYKKEFYWLDDILMPAESMRYAWTRFDREGELNSGVVADPKQASDHSMVFTRLNW